MRRLSLPLLLLLLSTTLGAQTIEFDPPFVTSRTAATVSVSGVWSDGCVPRRREAIISPSLIEIRLFIPEGGGCTAALTPYRHDLFFGLLQAGVYDVIVRLEERGTTRVFAQASLQVAEGGLPWVVTPRAVTKYGRMEVIVDGVDTACPPLVNPCLPPQVLIDGQPAMNSRIIDHDTFAFTPRPHDPGVADVVINGVRARAALRYYDPDAPAPDPAVFEPVLIPLLFAGPGQFGSQWTTEAWIRNESALPVEPWRQYFGACLPAIGQPCPFAPGAVLRTHIEQRPGGLLLYVPRDQASQLTYSVLIKDTSRQAQTLGTSIPVVREREWRESTFSILNVPADPRYRHTLRVYSIDVELTAVAVRFHSMTTGQQVAPQMILNLRSNGADEPGFAQLNLPALPAGDPVRVEIQPIGGSLPLGRYWAFISTTNNETQNVTALTPE